MGKRLNKTNRAGVNDSIHQRSLQDTQAPRQQIASAMLKGFALRRLYRSPLALGSNAIAELKQHQTQASPQQEHIDTRKGWQNFLADKESAKNVVQGSRA